LENTNRRYVLTAAELIDRLYICQLKQIFIADHADSYQEEIQDIIHDLNQIIEEKDIVLTGELIRQFGVLMLANRYIWENESKARQGNDQDFNLLKLTHSINGIRNTAKNLISEGLGERTDLKIDCFASNLPEEFGNWDIFVRKKKET